MRDTEFHKIIPERVALLDRITQLLENAKTHFTVSYAKQKLPFLSYVINPNAKKTIMITAGIHGNEPAPLYALYNLLKQGIKTKKRIILVPCVNPYGFCLHTHNNENRKNLNRNVSKSTSRAAKALRALVKEYNPQFVLNMHEDADESKFFLYLYGDDYRKKAERLIHMSGLEYYKKKKVHTDWVFDGIIDDAKDVDSFEDYLIKLGISNFCTETPGTIPFRERIKAYEKIILYVIRRF